MGGIAISIGTSITDIRTTGSGGGVDPGPVGDTGILLSSDPTSYVLLSNGTDFLVQSGS